MKEELGRLAGGKMMVHRVVEVLLCSRPSASWIVDSWYMVEWHRS